MKRTVLVAVALVSCHSAAPPVAAPVRNPAPSVFHGHVLAADTGQALPLAHVTVLGADGKPGAPQEVAHDGSFSIPFASFTGRLTRVRVTGAAHRAATLLVAREDASVDVTVKLGAVAPHGSYAPAVVLFTGEAPSARSMKKEPDGSFSLEVEAPDGRYGYAIVGVLNEAPVGAPVDGWTQTPDGSYRPQVVVKGGKARITFDPRKLPDAAARYDFADPTSTSAGASASALVVAEATARGEARFDEAIHAPGGPSGDVVAQLAAARKTDTAALRSELAARAHGATRPVVKQAAAVAYFTGAKIETPDEEARSLASQVLSEVPPDDTLWAAFDAVGNVLAVAGKTPASDAYASAFLARQPSTAAVGKLLLARLRGTKDASERRPLVAELKKPRFAGTREQSEASGYDPDRSLAPGKQVSFEVKSLTGAKLAPKDIAGKVTLIDLWGTWCAPCVAELPRVHELHAMYGGSKPAAGQKKRFEILSIALEKDPKLVARFREDKAHPMPWLHGIADPDDFLESFAGPSSGVPCYVLVDEKGVILASSPDLSPRELPELVARALR